MQTLKHRINRALAYPEINELELCVLKTLDELLQKKKIKLPYLGKLIDKNLDPLLMTVLAFSEAAGYWLSLHKPGREPIEIHNDSFSVRSAVRKLTEHLAVENPCRMLAVLASIGITRNMVHAPFSSRGSLPHLFVILALAHYLGYAVSWKSADREKKIREKK